jgi:steroid delta-isomerase
VARQAIIWQSHEEEWMPTPGAIQRAVAGYFAATRAMDVDAWLATLAADAVSHDPVGGAPVVGHQGLRQFFDTIAALFETLALTEDQVFVAGNCAAVKFTGRGVGKNGREVVFGGIDVFEVNEHGLIQKVWGYWDPSRLMLELMTD